MTQEQLDRLLAGQLSPSEYERLSATYGAETLRRIMDGDVRLRDAIMTVSAQPPIDDLAERIGKSIEQERALPRWLQFLSRWGVAIGLGLVMIVVVSVAPVIPDLMRSIDAPVSPLIWTIGGILLIGLAVAFYLEFGDRR